MKKLLVLLPFIIAIQGISQKKDTSSNVRRPHISARSDSVRHEVVKKEIGVSGGKIISGDGKIELTFPQGALTSNTVISIEPIPTVAPGNSDFTYQLDPSGIQFKKPVEVMFHYTDEEAETCPPELMALTLQDHKGESEYINYEKWDSIGKTLIGFIEHFSSITNIRTVLLRPARDEICVNEFVEIEVYEYSEKSDKAVFHSVDRYKWEVRGHGYGNKTVGFLRSDGTVGSKEKNYMAVYQAPEYLFESGNPVIIDLHLKIKSGKYAGKYIKISCDITIYDAYELTISNVYNLYDMGIVIKDESNFCVFVFPKTLIIDYIKNSEPVLVKSGVKGQCQMTVVTTGATGRIHITNEYKDFKLSKEHPPEVLFNFLPDVQRLLFNFRWVCPGVIGQLEPMIGDALTPEINFIANGKNQTINYTFPSASQFIDYKLIVKPIRE